MAFGGTLRTASANGASILATNNVAVTSTAVAVGDLVIGAIWQQTNLTASGASDNLGNTYSFTNAGTDSGASTGRAFYSRVTVAGNLTQVSVTATGSTNDFIICVAVIEGPFTSSPLDANPANVQDNTSPHNCPATGTLAQADEYIFAWATGNPDSTISATSPNVKLLQDIRAGNGVLCLGGQVVAATTTVTPVFTGGGFSASILGTSSFKKDTTGGAIDGTLAKTLGAVTTSAAGSVDIAGTCAKTLGALTTSTAVSVDITGTLSKTLGTLTVAATASGATTDGTLAKTLGALTSSAAGSVDIAATSAKTLGVLALSAAGSVDISGTLSKTLGALSRSAAGSVDIAGTSAKTLGVLTLSAAGEAAVQATGTLAKTLGILTASAAGSVAIGGTASPTLRAATLTGVAGIDIAGTLAKTLGSLTLAGVAESFPPIDGTFAATLGALTCSAYLQKWDGQAGSDGDWSSQTPGAGTWTQQSGASPAWSQQSSGGTWTDQSGSAATWTEQ